MAGVIGLQASAPAAPPRSRMLTVMRAAERRGLVVGTTGNVSARCADTICITPSRISYDALCEDDLVTVDLAGAVLAGDLPPSRELAMHLAIYRARPDVRAVLHTHSVHATAWSFLDAPLAPATEEVAYYGIGAVRTSRPAPSGSAQLAAAAVEALGTGRAALLARHGVVTVAETVDDALTIAEAVEHQAHIAWLLRGAGVSAPAPGEPPPPPAPPRG